MFQFLRDVNVLKTFVSVLNYLPVNDVFKFSSGNGKQYCDFLLFGRYDIYETCDFLLFYRLINFVNISSLSR